MKRGGLSEMTGKAEDEVELAQVHPIQRGSHYSIGSNHYQWECGPAVPELSVFQEKPGN